MLTGDLILQMDIEGSEYDVLEDWIDRDYFPMDQLLVELLQVIMVWQLLVELTSWVALAAVSRYYILNSY